MTGCEALKLAAESPERVFGCGPYNGRELRLTAKGPQITVRIRSVLGKLIGPKRLTASDILRDDWQELTKGVI